MLQKVRSICVHAVTPNVKHHDPFGYLNARVSIGYCLATKQFNLKWVEVIMNVAVSCQGQHPTDTCIPQAEQHSPIGIILLCLGTIIIYSPLSLITQAMLHYTAHANVLLCYNVLRNIAQVINVTIIILGECNDYLQHLPSPRLHCIIQYMQVSY